jgi:hypothetical protein
VRVVVLGGCGWSWRQTCDVEGLPAGFAVSHRCNTLSGLTLQIEGRLRQGQGLGGGGGEEGRERGGQGEGKGRKERRIRWESGVSGEAISRGIDCEKIQGVRGILRGRSEVILTRDSSRLSDPLPPPPEHKPCGEGGEGGEGAT